MHAHSVIKNASQLLVLIWLVSFLLVACSIGPVGSSSQPNRNRTLPINNGASSITYSTSPQDVLIRTLLVDAIGKAGYLFRLGGSVPAAIPRPKAPRSRSLRRTGRRAGRA